MAFSTGHTYDTRRPPPLPLREVQRYALVVPPLPHGGVAARQQQPAPQPGPPAPAALWLKGGCPPHPPGDPPPLANPRGAGGGGGGRGTAAELHGVGTSVYDLWAAYFATEPRALALRRWAESTVFACARELRGVGRAVLLYAEQSRGDALA